MKQQAGGWKQGMKASVRLINTNILLPGNPTYIS